MKQVFTFFLLMTYLISSHAQTKYDLSLNLEGYKREFIVSVPSKMPPAEGYPLVVMLHGSSGDKNVFYNAFGWSELGEKENFITVFPSSLNWCFEEDGIKKNNTKWACGELKEKICPEDSADLIDDVRFIKRIVQLIADTLPVNDARIFSSGFSNGSCMSHKMAMDGGDVFSSCAGSAGPLSELDSTYPVRRVPIWFTVGELDDRFFVAPYTRLPYGGDSILAYLNKSIHRALVCQGLTNAFQKIENTNIKTYIFNECQPGEVCAPYLFSLIRDLTHQYPNGRNHPIDAPALFWQFFNNPPATVTGTDQQQTEQTLKIVAFPNPSTDKIELSIINSKSDKFVAAIFNAYGQKLFTLESSDGRFNIDKSQCGEGLFVVYLTGEVQSGVHKIVFR